MNAKRVRILKNGEYKKGPVVYWMSRDQRVRDNWALLWAQNLALEHQSPLAVVFCLAPKFLSATLRQYGFMVKGLIEVEKTLSEYAIPLFLLTGDPEEVVAEWVIRNHVTLLVTDFDPLRIKRMWKNRVAEQLHIPIHEVDAHNIVPCWMASPQREYSAFTFRTKMKRILHEYLEDYPPLKKHPYAWEITPKHSWRNAADSLKVNSSVSEVSWLTPGEHKAEEAMRTFLYTRLSEYASLRNNPTRNGQSHLSPYLHYGHLSAQRVALEVVRAPLDTRAKEAFLEELIIRKELSDNFCFYTPDYDRFEGFPNWAKKTLDAHRNDPREYLYTREQFERAETHDPLWNAAQKEMVKRGKMHGYMRMYWAKKILEWTESPEVALETAIYLNDTYELDGRDPNGYTGIAWSIGGVHDRPWRERPVFGSIRYMSFRGCAAKFNIHHYINTINSEI